MLFGTRETFDYLRCTVCGVLWLERPPADLSPYYPPPYHTAHVAETYDRRGSAAGRWLRDQVAARRLFGGHRIGAGIGRRIGPELHPDTAVVRPLVRLAKLRSFDDPILDVGCGPVPERLGQLAHAGFRQLLGIDPMIPADIDGGIPVRKITIRELDGAFAMITFHHSFEHVRDPRETLAAARRLLRPGGMIIIRTPVMGGWFWETYGTDWWELDAPRHLFVHTRQSLEVLAREAGLEIKRIQSESTFLEILASDQIVRGVAWREPASCWTNLAAPELEPVVTAAKRKVAKLNAEGIGGRALFALRASGE
jgi:SAM-dependent methyltransferase